MIYLKSFKLLNVVDEHYAWDDRNIYNSSYPFNIFSIMDNLNINFDSITIFCGSNGCGKSTLLNIISEKLNSKRKNTLDKGDLFKSYVKACTYEKSFEVPQEIVTITSDDVFDYLLDLRSINSHVNRRKEDLAKLWLENKYNADKSSINNYEEVKLSLDAKKMTMSKYIRERLTNNNIIEQSNGESSLMFWEKEIKENSIYILDEPENSLSAENTLKLKKFIEDSARFYNCQFIISTHSPFLLNLDHALIYDLDDKKFIPKKWSDISSVKTYFKFFMDNKDKFM